MIVWGKVGARFTRGIKRSRGAPLKNILIIVEKTCRSSLPPLNDKGAMVCRSLAPVDHSLLILEGEAHSPFAPSTSQLPVSPTCLARIAYQIQRDVPSRLTLKTRKWPNAVQLLQWQYHLDKGITEHLEAGHTTYS